MDSVLIRPTRGWARLQLKELWKYRELLYFMVWRDVKVRYKQTVFGASWAIIQPFILMVVFTALGDLANIPTEGVPRPLFLFGALVPWTLFSQSLQGAALSLSKSSSIVRKIYFPRLILPISSIGSYLLDFLIALGVLVGMMIYYGVRPTGNIIWLPFLTLLAIVTALAVGTWLAAINAKYRDVQYAMPFLVQVWLFASPVVYGTSLLPEKFRFIYAVNPMAGVVEGFRWALFGSNEGPGPMIAVSIAATVLILIGGLFYFKRQERTFADVL